LKLSAPLKINQKCSTLTCLQKSGEIIYKFAKFLMFILSGFSSPSSNAKGPTSNPGRRRRWIKPALGVALAMGVLTAGQAQAFVVTVGGQDWGVTTFTFTPNSYIANQAYYGAKFSSQTWYGNQATALSFANAIYNPIAWNALWPVGSRPARGVFNASLQLPYYITSEGWYTFNQNPSSVLVGCNNGNPSDCLDPGIPGITGVGNPLQTQNEIFDCTPSVGCRFNGGPSSSTPDATYTFVEATPLQATPVPGPLPIFGAAAALGFSRQLRKRIKINKASSATFTLL
jgi:hypothetical protein